MTTNSNGGPVSTAVRRLRPDPVIEPGSVPGYGPLFNAGLLHHDGAYHLFARGVRSGYRPGHEGGPRFVDYVSDILVFVSEDGHDYRFQYRLTEAATDVCYEDPRVNRVGSNGSEALVMTYTHLPADGPWRIGAHRLLWDGERFDLDHDSGRLLGPPDVENKDGIVFELEDGRIALIHRIHPDMQLAVFDDLDHLWDAPDDYWADHLSAIDEHTLLRPSLGALGIGAGAPPVATDDGLLLFFHERRADGSYTMNLALLDGHTGRVRAMLPEPVLEPELEWERRGDVDEVVFVQGAQRVGDEIYLTYGAADRCVGAAIASVPHLLDSLTRFGRTP